MSGENSENKIPPSTVEKHAREPQLNISDLIKVAEIFFDKFKATQLETERLNIDFERELLKTESRQNRLLIICTFIILGLVLIGCGIQGLLILEN